MRILVMIIIFAAIALPLATAQDSAQRGWTTDNVLQWKDFEVADCRHCAGKKVAPCLRCDGGKNGPAKSRCMECKGKRVAPCRTCGATGKSFDTLIKIGCPRCSGSTFYRCPICQGKGRLDRAGSCKICKKKGALKCSLCKGKRFFVLPFSRPVRKMGKTEILSLNKKVGAALSPVKTFVLDEDKRWIHRRYESLMKRVVELLPQFGPVDKDTLKILKTADKYSSDRNFSRMTGAIRMEAANHARLVLVFIEQVLTASAENITLTDKRRDQIRKAREDAEKKKKKDDGGK